MNVLVYMPESFSPPAPSPRIGIFCEQATQSPELLNHLTQLNPQWIASRFSTVQPYMRKQPVDIVVCYLSAPVAESYSWIQTLSARADLFIIVMVTEPGVETGTFYLEAGAERCLFQPVTTAYLMANIAQAYQHLQRIRQAISRAHGLAIERWQLNSQQWELLAPSGNGMAVTRLEMRFLQILMSANGELIPRMELASKLYSHRQAHEFQRMEMLISRLRKKARLHLQQELPIKSSYAGGLAFIAESHIA